MNQLKAGHEKILQHIDHLITQSWLTDSQKSWPRFLFHFTDITNAKNILADGFLFSRARLQKSGKLTTDIASPEIIKSTADKWKTFVRLYFRPLTPMQYSIEGFRSKVNIKYDAHCPVPVIFVFDAKKILTLQPTLFSNGNLRAEGVQVGNSVDFYKSLPFRMIYHHASLQHLSDGEKRSVIFHRHAEVIIPNSLDLSNLKFILCRSRAEFETLIQLLPIGSRPTWKNKIRIASSLFFSEWVYIKKVFLSSSSIIFHFSPSSESYPFHARSEIKEIKTDKTYFWEEKAFKAEGKLEFNLSNLSHPGHYRISFYLDDCLAYRNIYQGESELF